MPIDMSAFEAQFKDERISPDPFMDDVAYERLAFLKDRISDINQLNSFRREMMSSIEDQMADIVAIEQRIQALLRKMRAKRAPLEGELSDIRKEIRDDQHELDKLNRELQRLMAEIEARRRFRMEMAAIHEATRNAPWRIRARKHQLEGASRLVSAGRGILGDKPGLGKTLQAIMTIDMLRAKGTGKRVIIFTPKRVLRDFHREFEEFSPGTFVHVLDHAAKGQKATALDIIKFLPDFILLTNYEVWRKDITIIDKMIECQPDTVIIDEAHNIKTKDSSTRKGIRKIVYAENKCSACGFGYFNKTRWKMTCGKCEHEITDFDEACSVKQVIPMTGTPILNKPQELWPLLELVDRKGFPDEKSFLRDYCEQYENEEGKKYWSFGPGGEQKLLSKLGMKYTARTRDSAGVEMPPQKVRHHYLELDPEKYPRQFNFIDLLKNHARLAFGEHEMTTTAVLAWYTRMRQAASWPDGIVINGCRCEPECDYDDETGKSLCKNKVQIFPPIGAPPVGESVIMDGAEEIISEAVESGERVVAFTFFRATMTELKRRLENKGIRVGEVRGGLSPSATAEAIDDFNAKHTKIGEHKYDVLLCQYQTSKVGLNLSGAHRVVMLEREWNPGMEEQAMDRVRRLDSKLSTIVDVLHAPGTITDLIDSIIEMKKEILEGFETQVNLQEEMRKYLGD